MLFETLLKTTLKHEGGFVNDPHDKGGATNKGITLATYRKYYGASKTVNDLKNISDEEVEEIYYNDYYLKYKVDKMPVEIQDVMFDAFVNHGGSGGTKVLQRAINDLGERISVDGRLGTETLESLLYVDARALRNAIINRRVRLYSSIVKNDPSQGRFFGGWMNRVNSFV